MLRKVYLAGDMGEKFGKIAEVSASTVREVMQYLDANHDGVREYLLEKNDKKIGFKIQIADQYICLLYTSPSPRDRTRSRMPSSA